MRVRSRKIWWAVGALVVLSASIAVFTHFAGASDRRTDQALEEIVVEYGFLEQPTYDFEPYWQREYRAPRIDDEQADEVLRKLEQICADWKVRVQHSESFRDGVSPIYRFETAMKRRHIFSVTFLSDKQTPEALAEGEEPYMTLHLSTTPDEIGMLDRLAEYWPW